MESTNPDKNSRGECENKMEEVPVEEYVWSSPRRTLQILVIVVAASFFLGIFDPGGQYPGWNWANYFGFALATGAIAGVGSIVIVFLRLLFTNLRLNPQLRLQSFITAMAIPALCIAPLVTLKTLFDLEDRIHALEHGRRTSERP